ncbi:MAG: hypothetical protein ACTSW1_01095 [Candidatus Hodarchaeales archaeon]
MQMLIYLMKKCLFCGKEFEPRKRGSGFRFCDKTCTTKFMIRSAKANRASRK